MATKQALTVRRMCNSCAILYVNGIRCHETGCPEAFRDTLVECRWCGSAFVPEEKGQLYCSDSCYGADNGMAEDIEEEG